MILNTGYGHGGDVYSRPIRLDFSANVNPFGPPEPVKAAVRAAADQVSAYPDPYCGPLRDKLAALNGVAREDVICGNGAAELIYQFIGALRPEKALLPIPSFSDYENALLAAGCAPTFYPLRRERGFLLTEDVLAHIGPETDLLLLCSPNNPTGRSVPRGLLLSILDRCRETGTWLFLDECFLELTDEDKAFSLADRLRDGDRVFLLRAFTKAYGMAGLRLGYGLCKNRELLDKMCRLVQPWNVSTLAQAAGLVALDCPDWPEQARRLIQKEKPWLCGYLTALGFEVLPGDANYLFFSGAPGLYEKLLSRGVLIRDCANYRGLQPGDCRIAVRTRRENEELLKAIQEALDV